MPLPAFIQAIQARFRGSNNNAFSVSANPLGLGQGGQRQNFNPRLKDMADSLDWISGAVDAVDADATATAADRVQTGKDLSNTHLDVIASAQNVLAAAGEVTKAKDEVTKAAGKVVDATTEANRSKAEADRGKGYADAQNVPGMTAGDAGKFLRVNAAGNGYLFDFATELFRSVRTANTALVKDDKGKLIDITSGTFAQIFSAAATLGDGWWAYIRNAGTGDITLDPNGSETIDGLASFVMYPGEARLIQCDGTAFRSIVLTAFSKTFISSATFIKPPGYAWFGGVIRSGGASGALLGANEYVFGGAGGGAFPFVIPSEKVSSTQPVIVGAGGAAVTTGTTSGNVGGDSSFGGILVGQSSYTSGGAVLRAPLRSEGRIQTVDFGASDQGGTNALAIYGGGSTNPNAGQQGSSIFGGGGGGSLQNNDTSRAPGTSVYAGGGGVASATGPGSAGAIPSGGGGASRNGFASGAGGRGQVEIYGVV